MKPSPSREGTEAARIVLCRPGAAGCGHALAAQVEDSDGAAAVPRPHVAVGLLNGDGEGAAFFRLALRRERWSWLADHLHRNRWPEPFVEATLSCPKAHPSHHLQHRFHCAGCRRARDSTVIRMVPLRFTQIPERSGAMVRGAGHPAPELNGLIDGITTQIAAFS